MKEKKTTASFDITAIFLLVMQVVVGGGAHKSLHWIARLCASPECDRFDGKKLAQEDKKSPCANALLQVTNTI
ncbi:hypothetical protein [Escherichia sp. E1130]|uniref:hypothetical protein n=1 Tax=Escherichia sp. E1130 TaxID=2041645 RepID=UPI0014368820|nr:hypothetical protein [Escherichia sp. E1130]